MQLDSIFYTLKAINPEVDFETIVDVLFDVHLQWCIIIKIKLIDPPLSQYPGCITGHPITQLFS